MMLLRYSACPRGTYSDEEGSMLCNKCQPGTFQMKDGQNNCTGMERRERSQWSGLWDGLFLRETKNVFYISHMCYDCIRFIPNCVFLSLWARHIFAGIRLFEMWVMSSWYVSRLTWPAKLHRYRKNWTLSFLWEPVKK